MSEFIGILITILFFILFILKRYEFIFYILPYNGIMDILSFFIEKGGTISILRGLLLFMFLLYVVFTKYRKNRTFYYILVFSLFCLALLFKSSDIFISIRIFNKIIISILYFQVGYSLINSEIELKKLNKSFLILLSIYIISTIFFTITDIGEKQYGEAQFLDTGPLGGATFNVLTYGILLFPLFNYFAKKGIHKKIIRVIIIISAVLLILNLTRIPVLSVLLGYIIFFYFSKTFKSKILLYAFNLLLIGILFLPLYSGFVQSQFQIREGRYNLEGLEEEDRLKETQLVWEEILFGNNISTTLFGKEIFNSVGHWGNKAQRGIHIDYNALLHGTGVVGFLLYFLIFIKMFSLYKQIVKNVRYNPYFDLLKTLFLVFFYIQFFISISGQFYVITFRTINFIYLGAFLSLLINEKNRSINALN